MMIYQLKLHIQGIDVIRGEQSLIENLSFELSSGQSLLLTGFNGSGKTSLLKTIAGFLPPTTGAVRISNQNGAIDEMPFGFIHYVGHKDGLRKSLSVEDNLRFWAAYYHNPDDEQGQFKNSDTLEPQVHFHEVVHMFGLGDLLSLPVAYLSAGQKRRVSLARLKLAPRPIWLLDEPTVSLDKESIAFFAGLMKTHLKKGGIILAATHIDFGMDFTFHLTLGQSKQEVAA